MKTRLRGSRKRIAFATAVMVVLALAVPLGAVALASHPAGATLEVLEEVDTNPTGTTHTLTAQLFQGSTNTPQPVPLGLGVNIDFEVEQGPAIRANCVNVGGTCSGGTTIDDGNTPASPDLTCTIPVGESTCSVTFTSDGGGTNLIRGFIDENRNNFQTQNPAYDETEGRYSGPTDCGTRSTSPSGVGTGERCDFAADGGALTANDGATDEPDTTDVVQKIWAQNISGLVCIDLDPNDDTNQSGTDHELEATVTNAANRTAASSSADPSSDACSSAGNPGTARSGVQVEFSLGDSDTGVVGSDDPNAFFAAINGVSTNPSGGGPNSVVCTTDTLGKCTVTIRTVSSSAVGDNFVIARVPGSTGGSGGACANPSFTGAGTATGPGNSCTAEVVRKTWAAAGTVTAVNASPEEDTNVINFAHTVTASARNALGGAVTGQVLTFDVTAGPHSTVNLDNNASTPAGFFGQCTVGSSGSCSASYTGTVVGDDTITVCIDANTDFNCTTTEADSGNTTAGDANDDQVTKHWVTSGQAATQISLDMEGCNGNLVSPTDTSWESAATANLVSDDRNDAHAVCAGTFTSSNTSVKVPVTFTITSGPGRFVVPSSTNESTFTSGSAQDLGTTVTVDPATCATGAPGPGNASTTGTGTGLGSYACAFVLSSATGTTNVRACIEGSTTICDTGTKQWVTSGQSARFIDLTPATASNVVGTQHQVTAKVTDRFGNGVGGVGVTWSRTGAGVIVSQEATTNADGEAKLVISSDAAGSTTVSGTIAGTATDCDEGANGPADRSSPTPGDCSDTAEKTWTATPTVECNDQIDNDGDGDIDFPADADCESAEDDDESAAPAPNCGGDTTANVIVGTSGADVLNGTNGRDIICGLGGNDVISGRGGNDLITGNGGDDTIGGGDGRDNVSGNAGNDNVSGNGGNDAVKGNAGNDSLKGNAGIDTLIGGVGGDTLQGGDGPDALRGGDGNDTLRGGAGDDALNGGDGRDQCSGNAGRDRTRNCE